jgi:hypothetical protein
MTGNPTTTINPSTAYSLKVRNYAGPTDLVIDVFGYYVKSLAAMISDAGAPYSGSSRILSATRTAAGVYEVTFDRNVRYCAATATVYATGYYASTSTWFDAARPDRVQVKVYSATGAAVNQFFYINVVC